MLAVVAACIRGNDRLKICVHNRKLWAQILCQNSIMDDADQAVQTALGRRLRRSRLPLFCACLLIEIVSARGRASLPVAGRRRPVSHNYCQLVPMECRSARLNAVAAPTVARKCQSLPGIDLCNNAILIA